MICCGIDVGLTGAVGVLVDGEYSNVFDIPTVLKGKGTRQEINPSALMTMIRASISYDHDIEVMLEKINAMPGQGVVGVFSLGDSYGTCRSVVACMNLRTQLVSPASWKSYFKLGRDKEESRALAIRLFPSAPLNLKRHHNRAESLLLAYYLWCTNYK